MVLRELFLHNYRMEGPSYEFRIVGLADGVFTRRREGCCLGRCTSPINGGPMCPEPYSKVLGAKTRHVLMVKAPVLEAIDLGSILAGGFLEGYCFTIRHGRVGGRPP